MADKGIPIRVITRTLSVMQAINRGEHLTMIEISRICDLPYPTTLRIIQSLIHEGMVEMEEGRKTYLPTALTQTLSYGYQKDHAFAALARPALVDLTSEIGWPAAILTRVASSMVVRDSTHAQTTMTFTQYYPGWSVPIWSSASGRAYMAFCEDEEREALLATKKMSRSLETDDEPIRDEGYFRTIINDAKSNGYAATEKNTFSKDPGKTSSIAVPLRRDGDILGALTMVFFASAMRIEEAIRRYLPTIEEARNKIEQAVR